MDLSRLTNDMGRIGGCHEQGPDRSGNCPHCGTPQIYTMRTFDRQPICPNLACPGPSEADVKSLDEGLFDWEEVIATNGQPATSTSRPATACSSLDFTRLLRGDSPIPA